MTNKLPEVGKRYKSICGGNDGKILKITRIVGNTFYSINEGEKQELAAPLGFLSYFEELPDQEPIIKKEYFNTFNPAKVQNAKEELEYLIASKDCYKPEFYIDYLRNASIKLVDALDAQEEPELEKEKYPILQRLDKLEGECSFMRKEYLSGMAEIKQLINKLCQTKK